MTANCLSRELSQTGSCGLFQRSYLFKLYHQKTLVGNVLDADANGFSMHGLVELTADAEMFRPIFAFFQDRSIPKNMEPPLLEEQPGELVYPKR